MVFVACSQQCNAAESAPPNILWVIVDDLGWRDLGCYGSELYETPNIDRLASQGARFTQAYSAYPRCVPSRFGMLTGKHPARFQGASDGTKVDPDRDVCIASPLQTAGYSTFYCGKWHLGVGKHLPGNNGFDVTIAAGAAGATPSHFAPYNETRRKGHTTKAPVSDLDDAPDGEYLTDRLTQEAINFIEAQSADRPFFAVLAHYAVHTPIEAKRDLTQRYRKKLRRMDLTADVMEPESAGENQTVQNNPTYAAMIDSVDQGVGRLLDCLESRGIADNTIVILTSDHGGLSARGNNRGLATSNRPLRAGKGHLYEGGIRIPLILRWPGVTNAGSEPGTQTHGVDFYPTLLEMAGAQAPADQKLDGVSFAAALRGEASDDDRPLYWHNPAPRPTSTGDWYSSAVREGDWKLLDFPAQNRVELYNLASDQGEARNVAEEHLDKTAHLKAMLASWRDDVGAAEAKPRMLRRNQP